MPAWRNGTLEELARRTQADVVLVWKKATTGAGAYVLAARPPELFPIGSPLPLAIVPETAPRIERDPARLSDSLPPLARQRLPAAPSAALVASLDGKGLGILLAWCSAPPPESFERSVLPSLLGEVAPLAAHWDYQYNVETTAVQLSAAVNAFHEAVVTVDEQRLIGFANPAAAQLLGVPEGPVSAPALSQALDALQRRALNQEEVKAVADRLAADPQATIKDVVWTFDRAPLHLRVSSSPFEDRGQAGRIWAFHDVSVFQGALEAAQKARAAQAASEAQYRLLAENASDVVFRGNNQGVLEWVSPAVAPLLGWQPEEMVGQPFAKFVQPEDLPSVRSVQAGLLEGKASVFEVRIRARSGSLRWVSISIRPLFDAAGAVVGRIGGWRDIQSEVEARQRTSEALRELQRSETRLKLAADAAEVGIWSWSFSDNRLEWDERTRQFYGVPPELARPSLYYDFWRTRVHPEDLPRVQAHMKESMTTGLPSAQEFRVVLPEGSTRHLQTAYVLERDAAGAPTGLIGINRDITSVKLREEQLQAAYKAADSANQAKSDFLANISHEIRTPMNAILGAALLLERSRLAPEQSNYVSTIGAAGRSMMALIDDVLDLSKIEAGRLELAESPFDLHEVLDRVMEVFGPGAASKGLVLRVAPLPEETPPLVGDVTRVGQVLSNLVSNAIKFTEQGEVVVGVEEVARTDENLTLRWTVRDSGIGIAQDKLDTLFTPFTQADPSIHLNYGGTGLGLALSRQLVTAMGGTIGVRSEPGVGSEFWFLVPFNTTSLPAQEAPPATGTMQRRLAGVRLLVVDDGQANRDTAAELLSLEGACCETEKDGAGAVARLRAGPEDFDLVLMDVQMPVMDGVAATRAIRGELKLGKLPIVGLSAGALLSQRRRGIEAGMNDFITKPFDLDVLVATILRRLGPAFRAPSARPPALSPAAAPPEAAGDFPAVPGIDVADAARRLNANRRLFYLVLRGLRQECADAAQATRLDLSQGRIGEALARMHKLAGIAGNASAGKVAGLARDIEARLQADERQLEALLAELQAALAEVLGGLPADIDTPEGESPGGLPAEGGEVDLAQVAALKEALAASSARALKLYGALRPHLAARHGAEALASVSAAVEAMRFAEALAQLERWYP